MHLKVKTKNLAIIAIYAALYAALVVVFKELFLMDQFRSVSRIQCLELFPCLVWQEFWGTPFGVFVGNIFSSAGPIDLLNTIPSFLMSFVVYYVYKHTQNDYTVIATCVAYSVVMEQRWVNAVLPVWVTTASDNCLRSYRKHHSNSC